MVASRSFRSYPAPRAAVLAAGALVVLTLWGALVWPTRYRAIPIREGVPWALAAREERLTGRVELLTRFGWRPATARPSGMDRLRALAGEAP